MLKFILSGLHRSLILTKWGWMSWMILYFMVSGACSVVTVHQPPVVTTALGHDVVMPCQLQLSDDEKMLTLPVTYWIFLTGPSNPRLWPKSETHNGRVNLLDTNHNSSNKSIVLRNVQWADSGKYLCKLSITTEREKSFRKKGNETLLLVYDTMIFNRSHNNSLLCCEVNVTREPRAVLFIFHNGCKLQTVDSAGGDAIAALPYITLSQTAALRGNGTYECQLQLNEDLITKSIFHHHPPVTGEGGGAGKSVLTTDSATVSEPGVVVCPEPWHLYTVFLLAPVIIPLGMVTVLLLGRC